MEGKKTVLEFFGDARKTEEEVIWEVLLFLPLSVFKLKSLLVYPSLFIGSYNYQWDGLTRLCDILYLG